MYYYCPIGGIVCSICCYPVNNSRGYLIEIAKHERSCEKHKNNKLDESAIHKVVADFKTYTKKLAEKVVDALPNEAAARSVLMAEIDTSPKVYKFCTKCTELIYDVTKHKSNKHCIFIGDVSTPGYRSRFWTSKNPKVLSVTFKVNDDKLNQFLRTSIQTSMNRQNKVLESPNVEEFKATLRDVDRLQTENDNNRSVVAINLTKNPDLWLARTGWTKYLSSYVPSNIIQAVSELEVGSDAKRIEEALMKSLKSIESEVRLIDHTHIVFQTVKCRPHQPWPSSPFALPSSNTFDRYFSVMKVLYRIIYRTYEATPNNIIYPRIILTEQQKELYFAMTLHPANLERVTDFWLSLASQSYDNSPYECALICAIALSSITKHELTFKSFEEITGTFAALSTVYKLMVIYKAKVSATMNSFVQEFTPLYLSHPEDGLTKTPTAMSWIIGTHCYAKAASLTETKIGRLIWEGDTLVYGSIRLQLVTFRVAISEKVAEGEHLLSELCNVSSISNLPKIPWDRTVDNMLNRTYRYSFLSDPLNDYSQTSQKFIEVQSAASWPITDGKFDRQKVTEYGSLISKFLEVLLFLVHVTSGQPIRGTEITIIQHSNGYSIRNVFIDRGLVCIITRYHKSMVQTNRYKTTF